ncbi:hypothetical protein SC09_Contig17orf00662 [Bacillus subtilis]|uniref:Uncharacterized protein n=1 Tax=Bacillus subtilis TaxID=1423 RepID=A0A0D1IVM5_BACIU|nr:hypothetical protein SC09_Contig17orf00662 [Bacillus subtilis]
MFKTERFYTCERSVPADGTLFFYALGLKRDTLEKRACGSF